jgi:predicted ATPase/DNA-binding SARP family transcriptional activator
MLYIHIFGYLRLFDDDCPLQFNARPRTLPVWAYLLLNRARPVPRDTLAYLLWPDVPEATAQANLRRHLYGLRHVLPDPPDGEPWLLQQPGTVQWNPAADCWLDVAEFERLSASPDRLARAVALYTGDLLPQVYDDWILFDRERLRNLYLADLQQLVAQSHVRGDLPQAITYAQQLLGHDPLQEDIARELIALRYQAGDRAGALHTYQNFAARLQGELSTAPMSETTALYEAVLQNVPLPSPGPPTIPGPGASRPCPHNLPAFLNPFFGREAELRAMHELFAAEVAPVRLLTLTGPAGVGKTRLVLEAASRLLPHYAGIFPDGILFVDLSAVTDPALVLPAIATQVGVKESSKRPLQEALTDWLRPRHVLLLLDNLEQVVAAGPLITGLLAAAPNLRVLVTSRTVLQVYGEHEYPLAPLPLPELERPPTVQDLQGNAAVSLFVARARERQPDFALAEQNAAAVAEICVRLDGLPLAIELAARQVKAFSPADILARLASRLAFLEGGPCDRPARQQTLRGAIDWSYQLLNEEEKALFAALGVFARGWTRPAAEAVCGPSCTGDVGKGLASLADKSLLQRHGEGDEPRFAMLQSIREYALELVERKGLLATIAQRHADYFSGLAERARVERNGPQMASWMQWMNAELDNLRTALAWGLDPAADAARAVTGARLAWALAVAEFWERSGRLSEGRSWCEQALRQRRWLPPELCVELLDRVGWFTQVQGDYQAADGLYQEALALARKIDNRTLISLGLHSLGVAAGRQGDYERAEALLSEAIAIHREDSGGGMTYQLGALLNNLAIVAKHQGNYDRAAALLQESLAFKRVQGDQQGVATSLVNLGNLVLVQQDYAQAEAAFRESMQLRQALGDKSGMATLLEGLAELALHQGQHVRSARLHGASKALHEALGSPLAASPRQEQDRRIAALRELLGEADFAAAVALGASMSLEQVVAYALG